MVEVEEVELDLGLSIGGATRRSGFRKPEPENPARPDLVLNGGRNGKREIQAMRRQEAKKKRKMKRGSEPECKRGKTGYPNGNNVSWTTPFRVQFVPLNNGFALPCWVPSQSDRNVVTGQTTSQMCIGVTTPFLANNNGKIMENGDFGGDRKGKSNGSSMCSSSVISDYQSSSSHEDAGSTDSHSHSHSHSAHSLAQPTTQLNSSNENHITTQPDQTASSSTSVLGNNNAESKNPTVKQNQPNYITEPIPTEPKKLEHSTSTKSVPMPFTNQQDHSLKETKLPTIGKPPKPMTQTTSLLPQMPYVSTTGNGPNGKTVNGFLYKYTKSEVCIVCVCHGSTFSPAEFVQHAGGTDISHPLRHITVVPSAFG